MYYKLIISARHDKVMPLPGLIYTPKATGFSIFGLSADSTKSNTTFKEKQKLPVSTALRPQQNLDLSKLA